MEILKSLGLISTDVLETYHIKYFFIIIGVLGLLFIIYIVVQASLDDECKSPEL